MNITPINNTNPSFNGKIINKGQWSKYLLDAFNNNPEVIKLASGKKDIIANMSRKYAGKNDINHFHGEDIYKLSLKARPENAGLLRKIISWFSFPVRVTRAYHSEDSMCRIINDRMDAERFSKKLNIKF